MLLSALLKPPLKFGAGFGAPGPAFSRVTELYVGPVPVVWMRRNGSIRGGVVVLVLGGRPAEGCGCKCWRLRARGSCGPSGGRGGGGGLGPAGSTRSGDP